jgi:hypothetical protein
MEYNAELAFFGHPKNLVKRGFALLFMAAGYND